MRSLLLSFALVFVAPVASAATFHLLFDVSDEESALLIDSENVVKRNGTVSMWLQIIYNPKKQAKDAPEASGMVRYRFDCAKKTIQALSKVLYDSKGNALGPGLPQTPVRPIVPDTLGGVLHAKACSPSFPADIPSSTQVSDVKKAAAVFFDME